jgi:hypothetical protein
MLHQYSLTLPLNVEVTEKVIRVKYPLEKDVKDQLS